MFGAGFRRNRRDPCRKTARGPFGSPSRRRPRDSIAAGLPGVVETRAARQSGPSCAEGLRPGVFGSAVMPR